MSGLFQSDCPGVFRSLSSLFKQAELATFCQDYEFAVKLKGNDEPEIMREAGVSFNPRLGRIVMILLHEASVRDSRVIRAAICASASLSEHEIDEVPAEIRDLVRASKDNSTENEIAVMLRLAWYLDEIRHLHMTSLTLDRRTQFLERVDAIILSNNSSNHIHALAQKVRHAIKLQRRRLQHDQNKEL